MKYIKFIPTQEIRNPVDGVVIGKATQREVLGILTMQREFYGDRRGVEVTELIAGARAAIREQETTASEVGYWAFEDAQASALKTAAQKFEPHVATAEANHPHLAAIVDQLAQIPGAAARPIEAEPSKSKRNGAAEHAS